MRLIVAVDKNWAIGYNGNLLVSIPADMKFFRKTTTGKTIIMGRKTLESFPNKQPLKDRVNIVISSKANYSVPGAIVVHSIEEAVAEARKNAAEEDIFCIGGGKVYNAMLPYVDEALVTKIDYAFVADTHIPNLDEAPEWELCEESEEQSFFDQTYTFCTYRKKSC